MPINPCCQAVLITVANHQPLRRTVQEGLQCPQVLNHRQAQVIGSKFDFGMPRPQLQVRPPQQRVIIQRCPGVGQLRAVDADAPSTQPAQQADHQHQEGFLGIDPGLCIGHRRLQADHRALPLEGQYTLEVTQEQRKVTQTLAQGFFQVGLLDQATADQGKTAQWHAVAVEVEELVIQFVNQNKPEAGEGLRRHPGARLVKQLNSDAGLLQQRSRARRLITQAMKHDMNKIHRDRIVFPHGWFRCNTHWYGKKCQLAWTVMA